MANPSADSRGTMIRRGSVWRINNALVEEVNTGGRGQTGWLLVSYAVPGPNNLTKIELLRLNVGQSTVIVDSFGRTVCLCDIRVGSWVDTEFSPAMTRSIPPQTTAFRIVVRQNVQQPAPPSPGGTTTDRIVSVDPRNGFLLTGRFNNPSRQVRFVVTNQTVILDRNGSRIPLRALRPGQRVRVNHADFMTMSIPPQTTAFRIQVLP